MNSPTELSLKLLTKSIVKQVFSLKRKKAAFALGQKKFNSLAKQKDEIKLDLGCSMSKRPGFIGIDLSAHGDIQWDLNWGIPLADNSVLEVRSDHFFEHLSLIDAFNLFKEIHRVLVPNGIFDFTIPHLDPYLEMYAQNDLEKIKSKITDVPENRSHFYSTSWDYISWLVLREGEHKAIYDSASIINKVELAGFSETTVREWNENIDINFRFSSIYISAIK